MKRIFATTALVMIMAAGASAAQMGSYQAQSQDIEASDFIGLTIYATDKMPANDASIAAGAEKDWDNVGEVNDVILGRDGQIKAVVLGVGGFLGIGEKDVAVPMQDIKFIKNGEDADDFFLVVNADKDALTAAPAYVAREDKAAQQTTTDASTTAPADTETKTSSTTTDNATTTMANDNRTRLVRPEVTREGYKAAEVAELTADKLKGARVYGPNDEDVGEINRLILSDSGQIEQVVLDVGGFLGMGEHQIAVSLDELNIVRTNDGSEFRVYIDANQANLKAQPEYKG
ncbi:PRC-barrel domain-containing protein (plasmid) [Rhizobium sp. TH2]|uniref:PRC-barrel domain-containing protein n=1 Tax=Rhizobium sp. TH2 TaxID=2775403 RepID=UPI002157387D|nr:PRC-barrel domain-containing protein [Rhizobium sp. TH2]UVC12557.1 PRC-barrel domain-containing protein [Rhizobium sp. TH2]